MVEARLCFHGLQACSTELEQLLIFHSCHCVMKSQLREDELTEVCQDKSSKSHGGKAWQGNQVATPSHAMHCLREGVRQASRRGEIQVYLQRNVTELRAHHGTFINIHIALTDFTDIQFCVYHLLPCGNHMWPLWQLQVIANARHFCQRPKVAKAHETIDLSEWRFVLGPFLLVSILVLGMASGMAIAIHSQLSTLLLMQQRPRSQLCLYLLGHALHGANAH